MLSELALVQICDGTNLDVPAECKYEKAIGTTYTESASEDMSLSDELYSVIQASMFDIMSTLGTSNTTGYDWTKTSEETMAEEESIEVLEVVQPGMKLYIHQAVGQCDGNVAKTEMFKFTNTVDSEGEEAVVKTWYKRAFKK